MSRCEACPVRPGLGCPDEGQHCEAIRLDVPGRANQIRAIAEARAPKEAGAEARVPLSIARKIHHCPDRGPPCTPCGSYATCRAGKGHPETGAVAHSTCIECQTEGA